MSSPDNLVSEGIIHPSFFEFIVKFYPFIAEDVFEGSNLSLIHEDLCGYIPEKTTLVDLIPASNYLQAIQMFLELPQMTVTSIHKDWIDPLVSEESPEMQDVVSDAILTTEKVSNNLRSFLNVLFLKDVFHRYILEKIPVFPVILKTCKGRSDLLLWTSAAYVSAVIRCMGILAFRRLGNDKSRCLSLVKEFPCSGMRLIALDERFDTSDCSLPDLSDIELLSSSAMNGIRKLSDLGAMWLCCCFDPQDEQLLHLMKYKMNKNEADLFQRLLELRKHKKTQKDLKALEDLRNLAEWHSETLLEIEAGGFYQHA